MPTLRALVIIVTFLIFTLFSIVWQQSLLLLKSKWRKTFPPFYHGLLCRLLGIRVAVIGKPVQDRGVLMVANHCSYLDMTILSSVARVSFVARQDVGRWPLFGTMTRLQESVFIERERRSSSGRARDAIRDRLRAGDALVLFPEGTSSDGNRLLPFKSALMGAVETELETDAAGRPRFAPVQPVTIAYVGLHGMPIGREDRPLFAWYGDMELLPHLWELMKAGPLDVTVEFHEPIAVEGAGGRKQIAAQAEAVVRRGLVRALSGGRAADAGQPTPEARAGDMPGGLVGDALRP
jgi:1-acyl-sn-glycerol-3-phosphate acyltransferase